MKHIILGKIGESKAVHFLKTNGYKIIQTNYKNYIGEIDIIASDGEVLCFVEVKTRTSLKYGLPREAVTFSKQNKIKNVAKVYLQNKELNYKAYRFDVLEVIDDDCTLIKGAFE